MKNYKLLLHYLALHKTYYLLGIIFVFLTNWIAVNIPVYLQRAIDLLSEQLPENHELLVHNVWLVMGLSVVLIFVRTISRILFFNPGRATERLLKNELFAKLNRLQKGFYDRFSTGTLISIINNDINGVRLMTGLGLLQVVNIVFALSLTPLKMWELSPSLTLYCALPVVLTFLMINRTVALLRRLRRKRMADLQNLSARTVGFLSGIDVIKGHQVYSWASTEMDKENQTLLERSLQISKIQSFIMPLLGYTDQFLKIIILGLGGRYLIEQDLTIGELTAFLSYAALLAFPFISLGRIILVFQAGMLGLESIQKILNEPSPQQDTMHLALRERDTLYQQGIVVKNLSFRYPESDEWVLKNVSFTLRPGQKIGILGKIGSGKSTLVNCLNRYLEVEKGQIFIDGHDITALSRQDLRSVVRTITQEPFLFSATITENVKFGSLNRDDQFQLEDVLYQSHLSDEVQLFAHQENTLVGEKGILLSGGQKQRLSLARAMYTPCKLLILDNVLSAVDYETERFLLQQIFENMQTQSLLIVSHRVSVLEQVDQIFVLDQGEIIARGTHEALLVQSEYYRKTWQLQQQMGREVA